MTQAANQESSNEGAPVSSLGALVEMLRHEMEASKSVTDHVQFLQNVASGDTMAPAVREHLVAHIAEEEAEHQEHLGRLLPALQSFVSRLDASLGPAAPDTSGAAAAPGLTVGSLVDKRPWYVTP